MLTNSCSPSKMKDGWIYSTYCPIFRWNVDEPFWTNRRILGRKRETWILENLRNFEYEDHGRKKRTKRTVKFDDICRSRQEVSTIYLMVEFQLMWCWYLRIPPPPPRAGRSNFENKKRMSTWREGVRQVTNTVRRNIGAQSDNYVRQYKRA